MRILAIDPGTTESAWVELVDGRLGSFKKLPNQELLTYVEQAGYDLCVIEKVESYGMAVGAEVFDTVYWSGVFAHAFGGRDLHKLVVRLPRRAVKMHLCGTPRAKDANIRQALIDKFGPGKEKAVGTKKQPGPLYGVSNDVWAALAVAVTYWETRRENGQERQPPEAKSQAGEALPGAS